MARTTSTQKLIPKYVRRKVRYSLTYLFLILVFLVFVVGLYKGGVHLSRLKPEQITIDELPSALILSLGRMLLSYLASLVFAFLLGLLAANSATGERIIIPLLDILQSVPVVAFFPVAITIFISLTGGSRIGIELAASFLIFTSQAWNMAFAVYEATKTIPNDNLDAIRSFGVKGSQRFWKLYAPASVPRLVYNSILSWSNGWFFLVACEIIAVGQVQYDLPGIGSFLARAAEQDKINLVFWGLVALTLLILTLDFLVWRPASIWAERFRQEYAPGAESSHRIGFAIRRTVMQGLSPLAKASGKMGKSFFYPIFWTIKEVILPLVWDLPASVFTFIAIRVYRRFALPALNRWHQLVERVHWINSAILWTLGLIIGLKAGLSLAHWLRPPWPELAKEIPMAILASTVRLTISLFISMLWILPVVMFCWNRPRLRQALNTVAQVGASLPAIALFPLIILLAVKRFGGGMEMASILLLMSGMQWYILFNCLGGAAIIPSDLAEAAHAFGLSRYQVWKRLVFPALRPALITGAITAWGGGWNALVVSEYLNYKGQVLTVKGLGALLNYSVYQLGDNRAIMLCICAMVGWIVVINSLVWRPLYQSAAERYRFDV